MPKESIRILTLSRVVKDSRETGPTERTVGGGGIGRTTGMIVGRETEGEVGGGIGRRANPCTLVEKYNKRSRRDLDTNIFIFEGIKNS